MDPVRSLALVLHIVGFVTWVGGLNAVARLLVARNADTEATLRARLGQIARKGGRVADVGAALTIVGGLWLLSFAPGEYMRQPWLHAKLTLVVGLIGLHGFVRVKAKRAADGEGAFPPPIVLVVTLLAATIVALAVFKPWMR